MFNIMFSLAAGFPARHPDGRPESRLMPYPPGHRARVRKRIIDSARRQFNRHGFEGVSLQQVMGGAGLTHGGFYGYFRSKSELYAEVMACFFTDPEWEHCWEGVEVDLSSTDVGAQIVRAYLSRAHFEDVENSCPMVALPTDVARSDETARRAFQTAFTAMVDVLARSLATRSGDRRVAAQAIAATCIGGMIVARTVADRSVADELRRACADVAVRLGGWTRRPRRASRKPRRRPVTA
jgi:TetR/AcrR family transcriptional regulator, transcriptional repressor for nem operon